MQQQHERVDEPLRLGDRGLAVLELRHRLRQLGLLANDEAQPRRARARSTSSTSACDQAVRSFQQQRGLRIDGVVDRETYRALDEARWRLGDRTLSFAVRHPYVGDDVAGLQHRLIDMGFDCGRADGVFGARTENALARVPAQRRAARRRHLRSGDVPGAAPARAHRRRRQSQRAARIRAAAPRRADHGRQARGHRSRPRRPRPRRRRTGRSTKRRIVDDIANRARGPARRGRRAGLSHPRRRGRDRRHFEPRRAPDRRRAGRVRERRRGRPAGLAARRRRREPALPRRLDVLLRHRQRPVARRRATRRPDPARDPRPHRPARLPQPPEELGAAAHAPGCPPSAIELGYLTNPGDAGRLGGARLSRRPGRGDRGRDPAAVLAGRAPDRRSDRARPAPVYV